MWQREQKPDKYCLLNTIQIYETHIFVHIGNVPYTGCDNSPSLYNQSQALITYGLSKFYLSRDFFGSTFLLFFF